MISVTFMNLLGPKTSKGGKDRSGTGSTTLSDDLRTARQK